VIGQIKEMVITQVITAGIKWIIGLLNPASAFVKACMAIYDIVMFFINQGSQVLELVNAIVESITAIAGGAVGGAAKLVENALVKALPVAIGFLASLAGVSGLTKKVQNIISKIRKRIDAAIDKLLRTAKKAAAKHLKKLGLRGEDNDDAASADPEHDAKVNKGLQQIDKEEKTYLKDGNKISLEDAKEVASKVQKDNPVFKSIQVIDRDDRWDYEYIACKGIKEGEEQIESGFKRGDHIFNNLTQTVEDLRNEVSNVLGNSPDAEKFRTSLSSVKSKLNHDAFKLTVDKEGERTSGGDINSQSYGLAKEEFFLAFRQHLMNVKLQREARSQSDSELAERLLPTSRLQLFLLISKWIDAAIDLEAEKQLLELNPKAKSKIENGKEILEKINARLHNLIP
jgi:hypothetical protein